mmetsp:Transcript_16402/g.18241  ORF Transcript_16402/g.18241 Transcript_16402/m.18241 type:complete len:213 (+) Transcript_16402:3-641(+)
MGYVNVTNSSSLRMPSIYFWTRPGSSVRPLVPPKAEPRQLRPVTSWKGRVEISFPAPATPMITLVPQPLWQHSSAARMVWTLPMHSKVKSRPPSVISTSTSWIGRSWSFGFTHSVAPICFAKSNLVGLMSTPMMREAPASRAPWMALRPTPPRPNTATVSPACTFAVLNTALYPVVTPQARRQTLSMGASSWILATEISGRTQYSQNVDVPM